MSHTKNRLNKDKALQMLSYAADAYGDENMAIPEGSSKVYENKGYGDSAKFAVYKTSDGKAIFSFKGSSTIKEFAHDFRSSLVDNKYGTGKVHQGFLDLYKEMQGDIQKQMAKLQSEGITNIEATGHSLGGALATMFAGQYGNQVKEVYTYGSPRVGDKAFADSVVSQVGIDNIYNVQNLLDPISKIAKNNYEMVGNVYRPVTGVSGNFQQAGIWDSISYYHTVKTYNQFLQSTSEDDLNEDTGYFRLAFEEAKARWGNMTWRELYDWVRWAADTVKSFNNRQSTMPSCLENLSAEDVPSPDDVDLDFFDIAWLFEEIESISENGQLKIFHDVEMTVPELIDAKYPSVHKDNFIKNVADSFPNVIQRVNVGGVKRPAGAEIGTYKRMRV